MRLVPAPAAELGASEPDGQGFEVWRDAQGAVVAYCRTLDGFRSVDLPDVARFDVDEHGDEVRAIPHGATPPEVVLEAYRRRVLPLILPALGTEVLHASGVMVAGGVVAFCGKSRTGKSTVAVGLSRRGHPLWADDSVAWDASESAVRAIPLPYAVRLRPASAAFFGDNGRPASVPGDHRWESAGFGDPAPLKALCVLRPAERVSGRVAIGRLPSATAFPELLTHAYYFSLSEGALKERLVRSYLTLTAQVPVFEIRFLPGLGALPELLDRIERELMDDAAVTP